MAFLRAILEETRRLNRRLAVWLTLVFASHLGIFLLLLPPYQTPDEPLHVDRIRAYWAGYGADPCCPSMSPDTKETMWLSLFYRMEPENLWPGGGFIPDHRFEPPGEFDPGPSASFGQPGFYYWSLSPLWEWLGPRSLGARVGVYRLLTALFALPIPVLAFFTVREFQPGAKPEALLAGVFVALFPMLAQQGASVNTDAPAFLAGASILYFTVRALTRGPSILNSLAIGGALSLGLHSKASLLALIPLALVGIVFPVVWRDKRRARKKQPTSYRVAALAIGLAAAVPGIYWWFEPLTRGAFLARPVTPFRKSAIGEWNDAGFIEYLRAGGVNELFDSFWGHFDHLRVRLPEIHLLLIGILFWMIIAGLVVRIGKATTDAVQSRRVDMRMTLAGLLLAAAPATLLTGVWRASFSEYRRTGLIEAVQGRYLFPAMVALAITAAFGALSWIPAKHRPQGVWGLVGAVVALDLYSVYLLFKAYFLAPGEFLYSSVIEVGNRLDYFWFSPVAGEIMALALIAYAVFLCALAREGLRFLRAPEHQASIRL